MTSPERIAARRQLAWERWQITRRHRRLGYNWRAWNWLMAWDRAKVAEQQRGGS